MTEPVSGRWLERAIIWLGVVPAIVGLAVVFSWAALRPPADERYAIGRMEMFARAQATFQQQARVDQDGDGVGEFGFPRELGEEMLIATLFRWADQNGIVQGKSYYYLLQLPDAAGKPTVAAVPPEGPYSDTPVAPRKVPGDADAQEERWWCYAWPEDREQTGGARRAFYVDQSGIIKVFANAHWEYVGKDGAPKPDAADSPEWKPLR
jgi:hypothetical protein